MTLRRELEAEDTQMTDLRLLVCVFGLWYPQCIENKCLPYLVQKFVIGGTRGG
jgi:hypothetical protein